MSAPYFEKCQEDRLGDQQALKDSTMLAEIIDYSNHKQIRLWVHSGRGKNTFGTQTVHRGISWCFMAGYNLPNKTENRASKRWMDLPRVTQMVADSRRNSDL